MRRTGETRTSEPLNNLAVKRKTFEQQVAAKGSRSLHFCQLKENCDVQVKFKIRPQRSTIAVSSAVPRELQQAGREQTNQRPDDTGYGFLAGSNRCFGDARDKLDLILRLGVPVL
jgi:hypothetical protein